MPTCLATTQNRILKIQKRCFRIPVLSRNFHGFTRPMPFSSPLQTWISEQWNSRTFQGLYKPCKCYVLSTISLDTLWLYDTGNYYWWTMLTVCKSAYLTTVYIISFTLFALVSIYDIKAISVNSPMTAPYFTKSLSYMHPLQFHANMFCKLSTLCMFFSVCLCSGF